MQPYRRDCFFSSLRQVERRIALESPFKGTPRARNLKSGNPNEGFERNPNDFPAKRQKFFANSEEKPTPTCSKLENGSREIQVNTLSQYTESSLGSPIMASGAQAFMDAPPSTAESEAAAEFLSHPSAQMCMNSSGEAESETWEECLDVDDDDYGYPEREPGGFDDIVDLCSLLKLDADCLQGPRKSYQSTEMGSHNRANVEDQVSTFYSKVAQVKGPKSDREVEALDAWIHHFADQKKEPFRLAHLLLAKAAARCNSGEMEFPDTAQEFLLSWPSSCRKHLAAADNICIENSICSENYN